MATEKKFLDTKLGVYIVSTISIILWGLSYLWCDQLIALDIPVEYFIFVRILLAGIILLCFNLITGQSMKMQGNDSLWFVLLAICEPAIYFICETYGIKFTESPTYSAMIIAATPILATIAGVILFKEKISVLNVIGIIICLGGLVLVTICTSTVGDKFILGVVLLIIAIIAEVGQASTVKHLSSRYSASVIVMYQFLIGSVMLLPFFLARGIVDFEPEVYLSWAAWKPILCLTILCSSIAFSLWTFSIKNLGVAKSSIFQAMIPVVTACAGFILGQELLTGKQWAGITIACLGLVLTQFAKRNKAQ